MLKIDAVIQPSKLAEVKASLQDLHVARVSISEVLSHGGSSTHRLFYRGAEYLAESPMIKLEMLVSSLCVDDVVDAISRAARSSFPGDDGTITVYELADAINIGTGDRVELVQS